MSILKWTSQFMREPLDVYKQKEAERAKSLVKRAFEDKYGDQAQDVAPLTHPGGGFFQALLRQTAERGQDVINKAPVSMGPAKPAKKPGGFRGLLDRATGNPLNIDRGDITGTAKSTGGSILRATAATSELGTGAASTLFGETSATPEGTLKTRFGLDTINPLHMARNANSATRAYQQVSGDRGTGPVSIIKQMRQVGQEGFQQSNLPGPAKVGGSLALDPAMYLGPGLAAKGLSKIPVLGRAVPAMDEAGKLVNKPGLTGKLMRGVTEMAAGFDSPTSVLKFAGGAAGGSALMDKVDVPLPEGAKQLIGTLGGGTAALAGPGLLRAGARGLKEGNLAARAANAAMGEQVPVAAANGPWTTAAGRKAAKGFELEHPPLGEKRLPYAEKLNPDEVRARVKDYIEKDYRESAPASPRSVPITNERGTFHVGQKTNEQWKQEAEQLLTPDEIKQAGEWYRTLAQEFDNAFGPEEGPLHMQAYLAGQVNVSVEGGLRNSLRAYDKTKGLLGEKVGGTSRSHEAALMAEYRGEHPTAWKSDKIYDFIDSAHGKQTRTYMGDDPRGGRPFAGDVHQARDAGFIDKALAEDIQNATGKTPEQLGLKVDFTGGSAKPDDTQYQWLNKWGNKLTDQLNEQGWMGRNDWDASDIQAIGWMKYRKWAGHEGGTLADAFAQNTRRVPVEAWPGDNSPLAKEFGDRFGALEPQQQEAITRESMDWLAEQVSSATTARVKPVVEGRSYWGDSPSYSYQWDVLGSPEAQRDAMAMAAYAADQTEVMGWRFVNSGGTGAIRIELPKGLKDEELDALYSHLRAKTGIGGATPTENGLVIIDADKEWGNPGTAAYNAKVAEIKNALADAPGDFEVKVYDAPVELQRTVNDWGAEANGEGHRRWLESRGGQLGQAADYVSEAYKRKFAELLDRHASLPTGAVGPAELAPGAAKPSLLGRAADTILGEPNAAGVAPRRARMAGGGALGKDWVRLDTAEIGDALGKGQMDAIREAVRLQKLGQLDRAGTEALDSIRKLWTQEYVDKFGGQPVRAYKAGTRAGRYEAIDEFAAQRGVSPEAIDAGPYPAEQSVRGKRALEPTVEIPAPHERVPSSEAPASIGNKTDAASLLTKSYFGRTPADIAARTLAGGVSAELDNNDQTDFVTGAAGGLAPGVTARAAMKALRIREAAQADSLLGVSKRSAAEQAGAIKGALDKAKTVADTGIFKPISEEESAAIAARVKASEEAAKASAQGQARKQAVDAMENVAKERSLVGTGVDLVSAAGDIARNVGTAGDLGTGMIQGFWMLTNPKTFKAWAKGVGQGLKASFDPEALTKVGERSDAKLEAAAPGQNIADRARKMGFQVQTAEGSRATASRTSDLGGKGIAALERIPGIGHFFQMNRNQFETMTNEWRSSRLADLVRVQNEANLTRGIKDVSDQQLEELVKVANHATGTSSASANPLANAMLFAPRFLEAQFRLVGDAFHGGMRGSVAREHLMWGLAEVATGTLVYNMVSTGEPFGPGTGDFEHAIKNWDETVRSSNFMKMKIGSAKVSAFGPLDSIGRGFVKELGAASQVARGEANASDLYEIPLNTLRGKLSPLASGITDIQQGTNAIGKDVTPGQILERFLPFTAVNLTEALQDPRKFTSMGFEYLGFKSTPQTDTDRLREAVRELGPRFWVTDADTGELRPPRDIQEVPRDLRAELKDTMQEYKDWEKSKVAGKTLAPDKIASDRFKLEQSRNDQRLNSGGPGSLTFSQWRDAYVTSAKNARMTEEALRGDGKFPDPTTQEGKDVQKYYELFDAPGVTRDDGTLDSEAFQNHLDDLRAQIGDERYAKMDKTVSWNDSPTVRQYKQDMRNLSNFVNTKAKYQGVPVESTRDVDRAAARIRAAASATGFTQKSLIGPVLEDEGLDASLAPFVQKALQRKYTPEYETWKDSEEGSNAMRWFSDQRVDDAEKFAGKGRVAVKGGGRRSTRPGQGPSSVRRSGPKIGPG